MYEQKCYEGDEPRIIVSDEFVNRNKLCIDVDAAERVFNNERGKFFGFGVDVAMTFLPFDIIVPYVSEEYRDKVRSGELKHIPMTNVEEAAQDFLDYMVFAWMKASDERGLSASRSISKLAAWMEILSRPDVARVLRDESLYTPYGKPALRKACEMLGIECPKYI